MLAKRRGGPFDWLIRSRGQFIVFTPASLIDVSGPTRSITRDMHWANFWLRDMRAARRQQLRWCNAPIVVKWSCDSPVKCIGRELVRPPSTKYKALREYVKERREHGLWAFPQHFTHYFSRGPSQTRLRITQVAHAPNGWELLSLYLITCRGPYSVQLTPSKSEPSKSEPGKSAQICMCESQVP